MAQNNPALFDALMAGGCGGTLERWITSASSSSYDSLVDAVEAFATAVDAAIPTIGGGPSISQINLLQSIAQGIVAGRNLASIDSDTFADIAASIAAVFDECETRLNNVPVISGGGGGVNQISCARYVDQNTEVPLIDQDGTIGAPFASAADAVDALLALVPEDGSGVYVLMAWPGTYVDPIEWAPAVSGSTFMIASATGLDWLPDVSSTPFPSFTSVNVAEGNSFSAKGIIVSSEDGIVCANGPIQLEGCQVWFKVQTPLGSRFQNCHFVAVDLTVGGGSFEGGRYQSGTLSLDEGNTFMMTDTVCTATAITFAGAGGTLMIDGMTDYWITQSAPIETGVTKTVMGGGSGAPLPDALYVAQGAAAGGDGSIGAPFNTLADGLTALANIAVNFGCLLISPGDYSGEGVLHWVGTAALMLKGYAAGVPFPDPFLGPNPQVQLPSITADNGAPDLYLDNVTSALPQQYNGFTNIFGVGSELQTVLTAGNLWLRNSRMLGAMNVGGNVRMWNCEAQTDSNWSVAGTEVELVGTKLTSFSANIVFSGAAGVVTVDSYSNFYFIALGPIAITNGTKAVAGSLA